MATATIHWRCWEPSTITLRDSKLTVAVKALQPAAWSPSSNQPKLRCVVLRLNLPLPRHVDMHRLGLSVVVSRDAPAVSEGSQHDYDERPRGNWVLRLSSRHS